jgi:transporter family protein
MTSSWIFWAFLAAIFAALTAVFAKVGVSRIDSDLATLVRTAAVLVLLAPFVLLSGKWSNPLSLPPRSLVFLGLSALATGASWVCYFRALQAGPASEVAAIDKFSLVLVALFAFALLGERPSALGWLGIGLVSAGVIVIGIAAARGGA